MNTLSDRVKSVRAELELLEQEINALEQIRAQEPIPETLELGAFLRGALRQQKSATLQDLKTIAEAANYSEPGKHLGRQVHMALVGMARGGAVRKRGKHWHLAKVKA